VERRRLSVPLLMRSRTLPDWSPGSLVERSDDGGSTPIPPSHGSIRLGAGLVEAGRWGRRPSPRRAATLPTASTSVTVTTTP